VRYTISVLLILASGTARAAQGSEGGANPDQIAVMPLEIVGDIPAGRPALEAAVLRGLTVASVPALQPADTENRLRTASVRPPCEAAECWSAIGKSLQARYLLTGTVERRGPLFAVEFKVVDARLGRVLATESNRCEASDCSVAELCRLTVRELARQTLSQGPETPASLPLPAIGSRPEPVAMPPSANGSVDTALPTDQPPPWSSARKWAIPAMAAGVAAGAGGGFLIWFHTQCAERHTTGDTTQCKRRNDSIIGGIAALGVGAALFTTGVALLVSGDGDPQATSPRAVNVSLGPSGFLLSGRF
jgi:hypothetical protein